MKRCREIMTPDPAYCRTGDRVSEAAEILRDRDIGAVPVTRDGWLVGILTDRDIVTRVVASGLDPTEIPVEEAMTRDPVSCRSEDAMERIVEIMEERQVRRVPVVDDEGRLVGIVAQADLARRSHAPLMIADLLEEISRPQEVHAFLA